MENFENKEKIPDSLNEKIQQELKDFFNELLNEAKDRIKQNEDLLKEKPEYIGEGSDLDYEIRSVFWKVYSDKQPLKEKLKSIAQMAKNNYENFVREDRWEKAEDWELSEDRQFEHFVYDVVEPYLRKELDKLENNNV